MPPALDAIVAAARATGKPAFPVASLPENFDEDRAIALMDQGIAPLIGLETALAAVRAAQVTAGRAGWRNWTPIARTGPLTLLDEATAKARLAAAGVAVPRGIAAQTIQALTAAAQDLTPPPGAERAGLCP